MHQFKFFLLLVFFWTLQAKAVEIEGVSITGEAAFDYNIISSKEIPIPISEGALHETYRVNGLILRLKKEDEKIFFLSRLNYAPRQYSPDGATTTTANLGYLSQLEVFYKLTPQFHLGFGRLITTMGYDSVMRSLNSFYNNTIAYQKIEPGSGEGLRAYYHMSDSLTFSASTYNQFNYGATGDDYTPTKATELSVTMTHSEFSWFAGYLTGKDASVAPAMGTTEKSSSNFWLSYKPGNNTMWVLSYDSQTFKPEGSFTHWVDSVIVMAVYNFEIHNLGIRYEIVRGASEIGYGTSNRVDVLYVTDKIKLTENLNLYIEGRMDRAEQETSMATLGAVAYF